MTVCEFRFEHVFVLGGDQYLDALAARLNSLFESRWVLDDAVRSPSATAGGVFASIATRIPAQLSRR